MSQIPILEGILNYSREKNNLFCMPGHKGGKGFLLDSLGIEFIKNMPLIDITEVEGLDNLHCPTGIIKEGLKCLARAYKCKKAYFLINGSTSGNLAMIFSYFNEGDKIIVERNCHKSIFNGIILRKLKPIYAYSNYDTQFRTYLTLNIDETLNLIEQNKDAKGIVLTYPNYYGVCSNIKPIIDKCKEYGIKVLIDGAHGAHFGCSEKLPKAALDLGADTVVLSAHKTLPSLTQTAYLITNDEEYIQNLDFYFSAFSSTSPSYLFLASLDYSRYYLEQYAKEQYENFIDNIEVYTKKINEIKGMKVLSCNFKVKDMKDLDKTRYVLNIDKKYNSYEVLKYLKDNKIQCEMCDGENLVLIMAPFNENKDLDTLLQVLKKCDLSKFKRKNILEEDITVSYYKSERILEPFQCFNKEKEEIEFLGAEGRVCATNITPYPPGIPLVIMGEKIKIQHIKFIKECIDNNVDVIGIENNKICVIK